MIFLPGNQFPNSPHGTKRNLEQIADALLLELGPQRIKAQTAMELKQWCQVSQHPPLNSATIKLTL